MSFSRSKKRVLLLPALLCAAALSGGAVLAGPVAVAGGAPPGQGHGHAAGNPDDGGSAGSGGGSPFADGRDRVPGRILIRPRAGVSEQRLQRIVSERGGQEKGRIPGIDVRIIEVPLQAEDAVMRALARNPNIRFAEPDYLIPLEAIPDDPRYDNAWHLPKIEADIAWQQSKGDGIVVAILDTGVDAAHPDLEGKLVAGWNAVDRSDQDLSDIHGHGTRVAGTVGAATDNGIGVAAVGWNAMIMPVRVTNRSDGVASSSDMARGLTWAADHGAHVANMSYASWRHATVASAAQYMRNHGGLVFGSAGNNGSDMGYAPTPYTVVVAATTSSDNTASWSNHGDYVDLSAPGAGIQTTSRGGGYSSASGTSFSSPVAAAVAALVMAADRELGPGEVEQILYDSAEDLGASGWNPHYGWGRVHAGRAVSMVAGAPIDVDPPEVAFLAPVDGAVIDGEDTIVVEIEATDNVGVARVDLFADGQWIATETMAPWEFVLETGPLPEGVVRLEAEAQDAAGNVGSAVIDVVVERTPEESVDDEPPVVTISEPLAGAVVHGTIDVAVTATDNVAVTQVDLYAGDRFLGTVTEAPYDFIWDTEVEADGPVTLLAEAFDAAGNRGTREVEVIVEQPPPAPVDEEPPVVKFLSPFNHTEVTGEVVLEVEATDNVGVSHVEFFAGDHYLGSRHDKPYRLIWDTTAEPAGSVTLTARAHDHAGNQGSDGVGVTVVHPEPKPAPEPPPPDDDAVAPPVVEIRSPSSDALVNGSTEISVRASGEVEIASISVRANDRQVCRGSGGDLDCHWATGDFDSGEYALVATAEDVAGNTEIATVRVMLVADTVTGGDSGTDDSGGSGSVSADGDGGAGVGFPVGFLPPGRRASRQRPMAES